MFFNPPIYTNVTQKGQVTLPIEYRQQVGINPRSKVSVSISEEGIVVRPIKDISQFYGKIKLPKSGFPKGFAPEKVREYMGKYYRDEK